MSTLATPDRPSPTRPTVRPPDFGPTDADGDEHDAYIRRRRFENWMAETSGLEFDGDAYTEKSVAKDSSVSAIKIAGRLEVAGDREGGWDVFDSSMGYKVYPERPTKFRKPDVSVIRRDRAQAASAQNDDEGFWYVPADLAVEVVSKHDEASELFTKAGEYLDHGFQMVWVVLPKRREVYAYRLGSKSVRILAGDDEIDGGDVLPGFRCKVSEFFGR